MIEAILEVTVILGKGRLIDRLPDQSLATPLEEGNRRLARSTTVPLPLRRRREIP